MASKADTSVFIAGERSVILREILGILLGLVALLTFLALFSAQRKAHWIGPVGDVVAFHLFFVLGHYVAFVLPVMLAICAFHALRGISPVAIQGHSWLRGLGGLLILISSCAVLALCAPTTGKGAIERAFELGGLVGNILVDPWGANIRSQLGRMGALIAFSGLVLIGLVLFTETLLRDLAGLIWGSTRRAVRTGTQFNWGERLRFPSFPGVILRSLGRPFVFLFDLHPFARLMEILRGISFSSRASDHVMTSGPIVELTSYSPQARQALDAPDPRYADEDGGEIPALSKRSSSVFPRSRAMRANASPMEFEAPQAAAYPSDPYPSGSYADSDPESYTEQEPEPGPLPAPSPAARRRPRTPSAPMQDEMNLFPSEFQLPPLQLLADPPATIYEMSVDERERLSRKIEETLAQFKVEVEVTDVIQGPVITRFALRVAPGVRVNKILALESELAMALKAQHVRILAPIPGQSAVGIEVPNKRSNPVVLRDLLDSDAFRTSKSPLSFALGKNISGEPVVCDLAQMPHLLIAGATGSGKSVCLNTIIASLLYRNKPDRVKFVMVDPKRVELSIYQAIPHLIAPVVSETKKAAAALAWCVEQMESRYKILAEIGVRNLDSYNALLNEKVPTKKTLGREIKFIPHIVIIIDELADLMMVARNEVEEYIIRLAQMARAVGIHLILATQRPSVNVITGIIKANFPSRIAFQVSSKVDSRTILDIERRRGPAGARRHALFAPAGPSPSASRGPLSPTARSSVWPITSASRKRPATRRKTSRAKPTPAERAKAQLKIGEDDLGRGRPGRRGRGLRRGRPHPDPFPA